MQKKALAAVLCAVVSLAGCSGKPEVGNVEGQLKELWGLCPGLRMSDLKKTNGVDRGNTYEMSVSYKLVVTKDAMAEEAWYGGVICPPPTMLQLLWGFGKLDGKFGRPLKVGDVINVNDVFTMVKSEKGWIAQ